MLKMLKIEYLKQKHSFSKLLVFLAPVVTILLATVLMPGIYAQSGAYNWWYTTMLPLFLTMIASYTVRNDLKRKFHGLFGAVVHKKNIWYGKIALSTIYLGISTLIFFILITVVSFLMNGKISIGNSFIASLLLFLLFAWQIPLWMYLSLKINTGFLMIISIVCNLFIAIIFALNSFWWIPFASPARVMCAVISVLPNGLPASAQVSSELLSKSVVLPALAINLLLYFVLVYFTAKHFEKQEI